jgi:glycosyltransferase involved in cell wall biosynthesis
MRIAMVVPGGVDRSGRERVIPALLWLIERLARRHTVHVFALSQYPEPCSYPLLGAAVHNLGIMHGRLGLLPGSQLSYLWRALLIGLRSAGPFDVLHGFWVGAPGLLSVTAGRLLRAPVVVSLGGGELIRLPSIGYGGQRGVSSRLQIALALRFAHTITAGSRHVQAQIADRGYAAHLVPLGVDFPLFAAPVSRQAGPPWRLLHVASINRVKDPHTLLLALRHVVDETPEVRVDWVGFDTLAGSIQRTAKEMGLAGAIRFHGFQPLEAVVSLYHQAHIYLQSSLHESQGVAVCEAAAAGVPTVGTSVGLVAELAPEAALAVPVGDAQGLGKAILALLADQQRRESLGAAAQAWARAHDADWTASQFEAIYERLCNAGNSF